MNYNDPLNNVCDDNRTLFNIVYDHNNMINIYYYNDTVINVLTNLKVLRTLSPDPSLYAVSSRLRSTTLVMTIKPSKRFHLLLTYSLGPKTNSFKTISTTKTQVKT